MQPRLERTHCHGRWWCALWFGTEEFTISPYAFLHFSISISIGTLSVLFTILPFPNVFGPVIGLVGTKSIVPNNTFLTGFLYT